MRHSKLTVLSVTLAVCLLTVLVSPAPGSMVTAPAVECWMQVGENPKDTWMPTGTDVNSDGQTWNYSGTWTDPSNMWEVELENLTIEVDPVVNAVVSIQNLSAGPQTYTFTVMLPAVVPGATLHGGTSTASYVDVSFDGLGSLSQSGGTPLYMGMIDGAGVLGLLPPVDVGSVPLTAPFAGGSAVAQATRGLPGPTLPSGPVTASIAIQHKFTLTAGDTGTFNSLFVVTPEPTTVGLLLISGLVALKRRR